MLEIEIDGQKLTVQDGSTVMEAADQIGKYIPHFCYHKKLSIAANCRMCLVQVEKAPKPLPACATPVTDGMKVWTHSEQASKAQKGVMEFLLINHPLDCPICDQGGECQLQDLAVGYGASASRYQEEKRVVVNKNLGSLIATDMTRCIHCTRCVRFGQEVADVMELGMAGRGEHSEIMPFIARTVDSELSGNMIDLCPVGALTSKPFRYSARTWELARRRSVSPHDGLGSNLVVQSKLGKVMRVLPKDNEALNECWLSDRDRFGYEGLNASDRLTQPMLKQGGSWVTVDWQTALDYVAHGLKDIMAQHGADQVAALATPQATLEELYLLQKLVRGLGSGHVDFRLRQSDFRADGELLGAPWLGRSVASLSAAGGFVLVGSQIRKEHPLLAHRVRDAVKKQYAALHVIGLSGDDLLVKADSQQVVAPQQLVAALAALVAAVAQAKEVAVPEEVAALVQDVAPSDAAKAAAASLVSKQDVAVLLGNDAQQHPAYHSLLALAGALAKLLGGTAGILAAGANSVGGYLAGAVPGRGACGASAAPGAHAGQLLREARRAYLLLGAEAGLDAYQGAAARETLGQADMVVALTAFRGEVEDYADVLLPVAPFTETSGTFINMEGTVQSFQGVVPPLGDTRPAWKVLRVLGNLLQLAGFEQVSSEAVRDEVLAGADVPSLLSNALRTAPSALPALDGLIRVGQVGLYHQDAIVRRAPSLQKTRDGKTCQASAHGETIRQLGLEAGAAVRVSQGAGSVQLVLQQDDRLASGVLRVPVHRDTAGLGGLFDPIQVERA